MSPYFPYFVPVFPQLLMGGFMKKVYALLLLGGTIVAPSRTAPTKQTEAVNPPFKLEIAVIQDDRLLGPPNFANSTEAAVGSDSTVMIGIRKTNITDHEIIKRSEAGGSYGYDYEVRDSSGNPVGHRKSNGQSGIGDGRGALLRGTKDMVLQPGEAKLDSVPLGEWYEMSRPGTYTIQISAHVWNDPNSEVVKSNIITVAVPSAKSKPDSP
jgi:hypothetical protein